jgi:2-haloacid dehalogenase
MPVVLRIGIRPKSVVFKASDAKGLSVKMPSSMPQRSIVVFDLGGVLIDWDPRYLYRKLFDGQTGAMEEFLATVCTQSWNEEQDAGRPFADGCTSLKLVHQHKAELIDAWFQRYDEMLAGPISGTVDILTDLNSRRVPLYVLSNWSAETFPAALKRFEFLKWFRGIMLSGDVKLLKPDPLIFKLFLETFVLDPALTVYIDDREANVAAAMSFGMHGILFTDAAALRKQLIALGLILA